MKRVILYILIPSFFIVLTSYVTHATPLTDAAERGDIKAVTELLNKGTDVNVKVGRYGWTALMYATNEGRTDIAKLLIDKGADVNVKNESGWTALILAAYPGRTDIAKLLIDKGADIDYAIFQLEAELKIVTEYPNIVSSHKAAIKRLERMLPKQEIVTQPQSISKEELKTIVQAAVEGAKTQKEEKKPIIKSDIDKPSLNPSQQIMGENDLAVIIGIEGYQSLPKSDYSFDDAKLVKDYIKALGFKERNIELITDEKATKSSIEKSLEAWLKNKAKADSKVFVYYSGHGAPDPSTGEAYLVPYDGDPNYLAVTGYPLKRLYDNLGKLQVAEVTVVLDSCFSGAGGRSVLAQGARPLVMMTTSTALSSNIAVLSATQGSQISTSSSEKGHGVFTYYFLKALKDGKKNIAEIYSYIKPLVEDDAKQLNVQQSPSVSPDVENLKGRFELRK
ncbi:MAG: ankyrin repeat domain-containing protein [Nitrospirae bacterium]|nr:ankyrin repeat domain-containing protein [Nitrospirota bacterium]